MARRSFNGVCFDMDGVLVDSERYWAKQEREEIFPATLEAAISPEDVAGMNVADLYDHLEQEHGTRVSKDEFIARYDEVAREVYRKKVSLLPGAHALLAALRDDRQVALVSSSPERWIAHVLERFGLAFDAVVSADHVEQGKPAPGVYERAAEAIDVATRDCVAVEDSNHGVDAARTAGMATIGFSRRGDPPDADRCISDADELRAALRASRPPHR